MSNPKPAARAHYFIFIAGILLTAFMTWRIVNVGIQGGGRIVYPFDDTYIHMGVAKNLAQHGTWGINAGEFQSADSSLLYVLILALCFKLFGLHDGIPLLVNALAGLALLYVLFRFARQHWTAIVYALVSLFAILLTPLGLQIASGMEHTLQILICTLLMLSAFRLLAEEKTDNASLLLPALLSVLAVMVRYESLALCGCIALAGILRKKYFLSACVFACGLLPVLVFGWISLAHGSPFIPNSLIVKSRFSLILENGFGEILSGLSHNLLREARHLGMLILLLATVAYLRFRTAGNNAVTGSPLFALTILALVLFHTVFVITGWLFRYDAYLIFLGVLAASSLSAELKQVSHNKWKAGIAALSLCIALAGLGMRFRYSEFVMQRAPLNILQQQVRFAEFLKKNYDGEAVVLHDIGTTSWYTHCNILDVVGLGTHEVISRDPKAKAAKVKQLIAERNCRIAVMYRASKDDFPDGWEMAGTWSIQNNVICKDSTVQFWAADAEAAKKLSDEIAR